MVHRPDREQDHHQQDPDRGPDPPDDVDVGELPWDPRYAGVLRGLLANPTGAVIMKMIIMIVQRFTTRKVTK